MNQDDLSRYMGRSLDRTIARDRRFRAFAWTIIALSFGGLAIFLAVGP